MIKVGDTLPATTLMEYSEVEGEGCSIGPNPVPVDKATAGKTIALFALPGAFTPTCSAKHVPGYVAKAAEFRAAGVDEIWCVIFEQIDNYDCSKSSLTTFVLPWIRLFPNILVKSVNIMFQNHFLIQKIA